MAELTPVDQVPAVKQWDAGKVLEGAVDQVIVAAHPADAGVGIEAR
jgi:hypothetical protein